MANSWINLNALWRILVYGLVVGAALPALFAVGVRLNAVGVGVTGDASAPHRRHPLVLAISWLIFALVLAAVIVGILFIARDFIGHHLGWYILGAKRGK
jgi:hypothetical protein